LISQVLLTLNGLDIIDFSHFTSLFTPAHYAEESKDILDHRQPPIPPYLAIFDRLQKICREQTSIIQSGMDQATLISGLQSFSQMREFRVRFCMSLEQEDWFEYFISMDMTMVSRSYEHHFRVISKALSRTRSSRLNVMHISDLRIPRAHATATDTRDLSRWLQESSIKTLKLTRSESALELLQYHELKINQLDVCGMIINYAALQRFLAHCSLCSVGFHDILISKGPPPFSNLLPFLDISILCQMVSALRKIQIQETFCHCHLKGHRILLGDIDI
jgi:hypothetical protein